ncbi:MAG: hypothetical protein ACRDIY_24195 [Chloroflexota bacterium]
MVQARGYLQPWSTVGKERARRVLSLALDEADRVIGIEPNADMRQEAARKVEAAPDATWIEYREGGT